MIQVTSTDVAQFFEQEQNRKLTDPQLTFITSAVQTFITNDTNLLRLVKTKMPAEYQKKSMLDFLHTYHFWMHKFTSFLLHKPQDTDHV